MNYRSKQSGYSLIEAIIYLAIFVVLSCVLIDALVVMGKSYTQTRINRDLVESANTSMERMSRDIRLATGIVVSSSTLGSSPGVLKINMSTSTTEIFQLSSNAVSFTDTSGSSTNLTNSNVSVDSLIFREITTSQGYAIKIEMTLHSLQSISAKSMTLSDTIALRGTY